MILFYSDYCLHCRMLLETIKRYDSQHLIKLVSIEDIKAKRNKLPPQITHVPALMTFPEKKILFGKQVFDYLLLPGQGKLIMGQGQSQSDKDKASQNDGSQNQLNDTPNEPLAFSMFGSNTLSDSFSMISDETDNMLSDRSYSWTLLSDEPIPLKPMTNDMNMQEETRTKKTIDLDAYKIQRDMELKQSDINTTQLPTAQMTR